MSELDGDVFDPIGASESLFTCYWNLVGNPVVLAVPLGTGADGLPLSMRVVGRSFDEWSILNVGESYQRATRWHLRQPTESAARLRQEA